MAGHGPNEEGDLLRYLYGLISFHPKKLWTAHHAVWTSTAPIADLVAA
jgi:hypothetical protein